MSIGIRRPWQAVDYDELTRAFPPPPEYYEDAWLHTPDRIAAAQLARLRSRAERAYAVPFFRRRWDEAGFDPRSIRSLDDLRRVPTYSVDDIRASIEAHPPWGDYQGADPRNVLRDPARVFMSGGTTGTSRPTLYTQWDREVGGILGARQLFMQGIRPGDVVLNSWIYGLHNGAFHFDEALYRWLNCIVLTTGAGTVTSTRRQVELAVQYGANAILSTADYLMRFTEVAEELGYKVGQDLKLTALPNMGDAATLTATFGIECFNAYGFHEVQCVAIECPAHDGLHVFEDAYVVEVLDPETGEPVPEGEIGAVVVTELYKTGSPQFRFNTLDLSYLYPPGQCSCGSWLRKIGIFQGRGDNMVKLRGVNVWPEALGELASRVPEVEDDYFVRALRRDNRDQLVLMVTTAVAPGRYPEVAEAVARLLSDRLGVVIDVEAVAPGALDHLTERATSPKVKRFRDER